MCQLLKDQRGLIELSKEEQEKPDENLEDTVLEVKVVNQPVEKKEVIYEGDDDDGYLEIKLTKEEMEDEDDE